MNDDRPDWTGGLVAAIVLLALAWAVIEAAGGCIPERVPPTQADGHVAPPK